MSDFINKIKDFAIKDWHENKILPSLTIAQAILESGWGKTGLAIKGNNLFGIKGKYNGSYITMPTKEYINGRWVTVNAAFRKYPSWYESIKDHSTFLRVNPRYHKVIGEKDYKKACTEIWRAGYATDPTYPQKLIKIIEGNDLMAIDNKAFNDIKGHWAESVINQVVKKGIMNGYPDGTFKPDKPATRAELASIIVKLLNK